MGDAMTNGPELVIGLVGAIGTDLRYVTKSLSRQLTGVGYGSSEVHVSQLLHDINAYNGLASITDKQQYYTRHMDAGNDFCAALERGDAMALLAILQVKTNRAERHGGSDDTPPLPRHAFIINSLKRKAEIDSLRRVYGDAFILLGTYAARDVRRDMLALSVAKSQNKEASECRSIAEQLIARDEEERNEFGQHVSDTYYRADAFIDATERTRTDDAIRRFVEVVFGHPFATPTADELAMQYAFTAGLRSADLSRQVGAAIVTYDGQLLTLGTNDVAKAGGGIYWPGEYDHRDFRYADRDEPNAEMKRVILADMLTRLRELDLLAPGVTLDEATIAGIGRKLKDSRLMSITEYGRAVHAEMSAITEAARRGISVSGARLFCTTFPCHNCAKHIVAAGIREVIYIEPYSKSRVAALFADSIAVDRQPSPQQVGFSPFVGFAPTRFAEFFQLRGRVDAERHILNWDVIRSTAQPRVSGIPTAYLAEEVTAIKALNDQILRTQLAIRKAEPHEQRREAPADDGARPA